MGRASGARKLLKAGEDALRIIGLVFAGVLALGSVLDAVSNAISIIKPPVTFVGTLVLVVFWIGAEVVGFRVVERDEEDSAAKGLGIKRRAFLVGMIILLWLPRIFGNDLTPKDMSRNGGGTAPPIDQKVGEILEPRNDEVVSGPETVRVVIHLPGTYAAVLIRPELEGSYWVQEDGVRVIPSTELPMRATFGGRDRYQVYVGVTYDQQLFEEGDRLSAIPPRDGKGRPVYVLGPVEVKHE